MNRVRELVHDLREAVETGNMDAVAAKLDELESWVGTETATTVSECKNCGSEDLDFRPPEYMADDEHIQRIPCRECGHVQIETWVLKAVEAGDDSE